MMERIPQPPLDEPEPPRERERKPYVPPCERPDYREWMRKFPLLGPAKRKEK